MSSALWFCTNKCNSACPYCWQHDKPLCASENTCDNWIAAFNKLNPTILDITGGEPFTIPWMIDFIQGVNSKVAITTNLTTDLVPLVNRVSPNKLVCITASWHPTSRKMSLDYFTGKCLMLQSRGYHLTVNFVTWPEQIGLINYYNEWFKSHKIRFHVDPYCAHSEEKKCELTTEEKENLKKYATENRSPHPWTKKYGQLYTVKCDGGMNHFCIQPDGRIWRCLTWFVHNHPPMGNIFDETFTVHGESMQCSLHYTCAGCDRDKVYCELLP